jgi:hypothetical protein
MLIATHLVPYILLPAIMIAIWSRREALGEKLNSVLALELGFAALILSMVFEFLWHALVQNWDYRNEEHWLNAAMYIAMNAGFALIAYGFRKGRALDMVLLAGVIASPIAYFAFHVKPVIWAVQAIGLAAITARAWLVLRDWRVFLFPLFSFGVNMAFTMLLFSTGDPLYHVLHDLLGTLLGTAIFGWAIWAGGAKRVGADAA